MPSVIITPSARADILRLREFLREKSPQAAYQFGNSLADTLDRLAQNPRMGRPIEQVVGLHRLVMPFGAAGYVLHYRYLAYGNDDRLYLLRLRHSREIGN